MSRIFTLLLLASLASALVLLSKEASRVLSAREAKTFQLLAQDWKAIHLQTNHSRRPSIGAGDAIDWTGGGVFYGEAQYVSQRVVGWSDERPYLGEALLSAEAELTLLDVRGFVWGPFHDSQSGLFGVQLISDSHRIVLRTPFSDFSSVLSSRIAYKSKAREKIEFRPRPGYRGLATLPLIEVLANEPVPFGWNLRLGCHLSLQREYDSRTVRKSKTVVHEECPPDRSFDSPSDREFDGETSLQLTSYNTPVQQRTLLILPRGFEVSVDGRRIVDQTADRYIAVIQNPDRVTRAVIHPLDLIFEFSVHSTPRLADLDTVTYALLPGTRQLSIEGAVGKVAVGLSREQTDEISQLSIESVNLPEIESRFEPRTDTEGNIQPRQFLKALGVANRVTLNGEELVPTRWASMSAEVRGVLVGTLLGVVGWSLLYLVERRWRGLSATRSETKSEEPATSKAGQLALGLWAGLLVLWLIERGRRNRAPPK